jgi:predicted anti-sigma-YlaC factor YlaD
MNRDDIHRVLGPEGPELTCEACFDELDRYVELELEGVDADTVVPGMRAHLEGCPACREDHDSLREFLAGESA